MKEAAALLHDECVQSLSVCEAALKNCLLAFSLSEGARGVAGGSDEPLFAFKLHQFISGAGRLYATLDHAGSRSVTFDGQVFDPTHPDKRLFATHFCRRCGQEHHPVNALEEMGTTRFEKREIDDVPINDDDDTDGAAFARPAASTTVTPRVTLTALRLSVPKGAAPLRPSSSLQSCAG